MNHENPPQDAPAAPDPETTPDPKSARKRKTSSRKAKSPSNGKTLAQLGAAYLEHLERAHKSAGTLFSYSQDFRLALEVLGAETLISDLTPQMVQAFFTSDLVMKTKTGAPKARPTYLKSRRVLRMALTWAAEQDWIPTAPLPEPVAD